MMRNIIALLLIIGGIILSLYVGIWVCFIGGITALISEIRAEHLEAMDVAFSIARIAFSGGIGSLAGAIFIPGLLLRD